MSYTKQVEDGYILMIGTGGGGTEITEAEYNEIMTVIRSKPAETETVGYRLKEDLTWEEYEKPAPEPDDPTPDDILSVLLGGAAE